jgi:5'-3' exonuclease
MSKRKEYTQSQPAIPVGGKKYTISHELESALKREGEAEEKKQKEKLEELRQKIKILTQSPVKGMTPCLTIEAMMNEDGTISTLTKDMHPCLRHDPDEIIAHTARCCALISQKWMGLNKQMMEEVYGKMPEEAQGTDNNNNSENAA